MKTYITSDIHFSHRNILKYNRERIQDSSIEPDTATPEQTDYLVGLMNEKIIENWNSVITGNDTVYILGDVAMGKISNAPMYIQRLNGRKILIKGNHDKTLVKLPEINDLFSEIYDYKEKSFSVDTKKHMVIMSHYPFQSWNGMGNGTIMLHGHTHGNKTGVTGRTKDIGMDTNNLFPYLLEDVIRELLKIEVFRSHHDDQ